MTPNGKPRVLIAGGGVAAVEALLALKDAAGDRVTVSVLSASHELELRALTVATPFSQSPERRRFPLAPLAERGGAERHTGTLAEVVPEERRVVTADGQSLPYDHLILAVGARPRAAF